MLPQSPFTGILDVAFINSSLKEEEGQKESFTQTTLRTLSLNHLKMLFA